MIARVEKPYTREEYKNLSSDDKKKAREDLIKSYIAKFEEVKQPHLIRTARRLFRRLQVETARDEGVSICHGVKHYEKGDYWRYCEAMAEPIKALCATIKDMCIISREHGYSFNPYSVNVLKCIDMFVQYIIPISAEYGTESDSEAPEVSESSVSGEYLFD